MKHVPILAGAAAIVVTLVLCTAAIAKRIDEAAAATASMNESLQLSAIEARLKEIEQYACSLDRTLNLVELDVARGGPPRAVAMPQPCPGDPGQER
jgi:hypothetical protein